MNLKKLKEELTCLKEKYNSEQNNVFDYYCKVMDTLDDYAEKTNNYGFRKVILCVVHNKDLFGIDESCKSSNNLYIFNGWKNVSLLEYENVNEIIEKSISYLSKEEDFDIC